MTQIQTKFDDNGELHVNPNTTLLTLSIKNRRYLGNKYKLLPFIKKIVDENCTNVNIVADVFAGTGSVASAFLDHTVITNDILYSNYISHVAWFSPEPYSEEKIITYLQKYNSADVDEENYMTEKFADTFFSRKVCSKIGYIREDIEHEYNNGAINFRERALLLTSLLYAMDHIANTCGHYDAYRKGVPLPETLELRLPKPHENNSIKNTCYNIDSNELVSKITADLVYIDPPYNSRQYSDAYHLLENVAMWKKPEVFGDARKMDRTALKSKYCTNKAVDTFEDLVEKIQARYILFSYNNMEGKGNDRSNAKLPDTEILRILRNKGKVTVFSESYRAFSTGKSAITGHEERLFLCECGVFPLCEYRVFTKKGNKEKYVASPLNYTGGKVRLLPQILPQFPKYISTFVDLFCGGCNVGLNAAAEKTIFNDINSNLISLYSTFKKMDKDKILNTIDEIIATYGFSDSTKNGYDYYECSSVAGLGKYNKGPFLKLREYYNSQTMKSDYTNIVLYVLIVFSFNNQIRFNKDGKFNLPVGKRDFNSQMKKKLVAFIDKIKASNYSFTSVDFRNFDLDTLPKESFIYCDPPYLITCATYNEQGGWNETLETALLSFLDRAHDSGCKFALSNVLFQDNKVNLILKEWIEKNSDKYRAIHLNYNYSNSNYHKNKTSEDRTICDEVLIINY